MDKCKVTDVGTGGLEADCKYNYNGKEQHCALHFHLSQIIGIDDDGNIQGIF